MKKRNTILLPGAQKTISVLGENIKLARLRRKFSSQQVAERADISRPTLISIEKGKPNVTIGAYVKVLSVLGLENDIMEVGKDDKLGRKLQDAKLIVKERASKIFKNDKFISNPQVSKINIKG
jgi:transcriptional regulator with XRE-family HTH domain